MAIDPLDATAKSAAPRRSERARKAILVATLDLVSTVGYGGLTMEGIASAAGVGKQTIYRWWPSKVAVLFDAILEKNSQAAGEIVVPDSGNLAHDLGIVLRATVAELVDPDNDRLQRAVTAEIQGDTALAEELVRRLLRPQMEATAARIEAGIQVGQVSPTVDPLLAVDLIFGPIFHRWLLRTGELTPTYVDSVLDLVLQGLEPREPTCGAAN